MLYHYLSEKDEEFLIAHDFSKQEVLDGMNRLMRNARYADIIDIVEGTMISRDALHSRYRYKSGTNLVQKKGRVGEAPFYAASRDH